MSSRAIQRQVDAVSSQIFWEDEGMTVDQLVKETLVEKNRRLRQRKCPHEEIYSSTVHSPDGTFTNRFCFDCGKSWHESIER